MSTHSNTRIRHAERADLPTILALNAQLNPSDLPLPPAEQVEQVWGAILANPIMHTFVAEQAGRVVATCVLAIIPNLTRGTRPYGLIENVVVDQQARGGGIGTLLMRGALEFAWQRQCYKVMLMTGRAQAVGFYERAGFRSDEKFGLVAKPPRAGG
ncbi:GNAT family N-acetyltransferase [Chloroflexia bacterium SDU3-3]|nr:GNAT family N-acetyltransferase [Chloroflexia bacterium SDU3-3]